MTKEASCRNRERRTESPVKMAWSVQEENTWQLEHASSLLSTSPLSRKREQRHLHVFKTPDSSDSRNRARREKKKNEREGETKETEQSKHPSNRPWSSLINVKTNILQQKTVCLSRQTHTHTHTAALLDSMTSTFCDYIIDWREEETQCVEVIPLWEYTLILS